MEIYLNEILKRFQQQNLLPEELNRFLRLTTETNEQENLTIEPIQEENQLILQHAPCLSISDQCSWNVDQRGSKNRQENEIDICLYRLFSFRNLQRFDFNGSFAIDVRINSFKK